jgi:hypothetical protein
MYFFLSLESALFLVRILSYNLFYCGVSFVILPKPSSFIIECRALPFGEELRRFTLPSCPPEALSEPKEKKVSSFEKVLVSAGNEWSGDIQKGKVGSKWIGMVLQSLRL